MSGGMVRDVPTMWSYDLTNAQQRAVLLAAANQRAAEDALAASNPPVGANPLMDPWSVAGAGGLLNTPPTQSTPIAWHPAVHPRLKGFGDDWTANWNQPTQNSTVTTASGAQVPYNLAPNQANGSAPLADTVDANGNPVYYPGNAPGATGLPSWVIPAVAIGGAVLVLMTLASGHGPFHGYKRRSRK